MPTRAAEPACWSLPLWLGWLPCVPLALGAGMIGLALAWTWSVDARKAASVSNLLAQGTAEVKPLPPQISPPDGSWWKSTSANMVQWALYYDRRSTSEPENAGRALALLEGAAKASPFQSQVRFALARRPAEVDRRPPLESSLGLSRDVVSLSWSAHQWLQAGKKDAALKAYRAALELAARAELSRLTRPTFDDDPHIKRYRLPGEDMIGMVIRDMADHEGWAYAEWSEALPRFALVPLTAARLLRERGSPDSEKALDAIVASLDAPPPDGCSAPLHTAAQAEALAMKSQWTQAEARYREAIAAMPNDAVKRSWWINVSDVALKLNDESGRQRALESAKGNDASDEIAQRAVDILKYSIVSAEKPRSPR
jgi:tetratricopeptide (TPR) repeat protein